MRDEKKHRPLRETVSNADDDGFRKFWLSHLPHLRAHALRCSGGNPAVADDALRVARRKTARAYSELASRNRRAWLLRLVHEICMDRQRNNRRQSRLEKDVTDTDEQEKAEAAPTRSGSLTGTRTRSPSTISSRPRRRSKTSTTPST